MLSASLTIFFVSQILPLLILLGVLYILIRPLLSGAVYFPTAAKRVGAMVKIAGSLNGQRAADLGSGDGRIVMALAEAGAEAHGYEVNPWLVWRSRAAVKKAGLESRAFIHWQSFWRENLSSFNLITVYGFPHMMKKLERKLHQELEPGAKVVSNIYQFPGWTPSVSENKIHLYERI